MKSSISEHLDVSAGARSLSVFSPGIYSLTPATPPKYSV